MQIRFILCLIFHNCKSGENWRLGGDGERWWKRLYWLPPLKKRTELVSVLQILNRMSCCAQRIMRFCDIKILYIKSIKS